MTSCVEKYGNKVESFITRIFGQVGNYVSTKPRQTIVLSFLLTAICGAGFARWTTENRAEKLWVPQDTIAEIETRIYESYFGSSSRFNTIIIQADTARDNVLTRERLEAAIKMHLEIETNKATVEGDDYTLLDLCTSGGSCVSRFDGVCRCLVSSILRQWNYDLATFQNDTDFMTTLNAYGSKEDLTAVLGNPVFDDDSGTLLSAQAFTLSYFLDDRTAEAGSDEKGTDADPINEGWEKDVFLATVESVPSNFTSLSVDYLAGRSFSDEFGSAISGDLFLVQVAYVVVFLFLGANLGRIIPGPESRWTMSLAALFMVGLSTGAGFGLSSAFGLFFGPVHSLLPFILLGIGVDDAFVIVNAFDRERSGSRKGESNDDLAKRGARALARAGASITVTSFTDLVAFAISASSSLPALASFCAYASVGIVFLWIFASTFFTASLVLDERRQRDNRRECLCWLTRKKGGLEEDDENEGEGEGNNGKFHEGNVSLYFRNVHAPTILSRFGKVVVCLFFSALLGLGIWGALNLSVENTERAFIPSGSYLTDYINAADKYYPSSGIDLDFIFEGSSSIYEKRVALSELDTRLSGKSSQPPYIAEPTSERTYRNVMAGLRNYLTSQGTAAIGGATLGADNWPTSESDFVSTIKAYASITGPGAVYFQDVSYSDDGIQIDAIRVQSSYVALTKTKNNGYVIDDAVKQIDAMDETRELISSWGDELPTAYPYSQNFIGIEGFKIIRYELFFNVALALVAVAVIVLVTVASPVTAFLITINVAFCIVEILGFMYFLDIAIDSVSVINIVLSVGLSIDYSAHIGHSFMTKGGDNKDRRVLEALSDIGAAVLSGAATTFLAVVVLLFSSSYVFATLSKQFALTVGFGVIHGLVLLPVLLSLVGPKAFETAEMPRGISKVDKKVGDDHDLALEHDA
eukprot:CAMPEP_0176499398 /NCGR_PEP_ID=MMETSP0200_2-20121128/12903_1 /TAXON_ID=947934 /ORGANISM="Chaetoceros sp., Strain GSL56" /LENGTH=920 /DNA_ID=CAMNT_0017897809 /DNA_START=84 /DNA_END=2846 /DNA_ORIENTATION=-